MSFMSGFVQGRANTEKNRIQLLQHINSNQSGLISAMQKELGRTDKIDQLEKDRERMDKKFASELKRSEANTQFRETQEKRVALNQSLNNDFQKQRLDVAKGTYSLRQKEVARLDKIYKAQDINTATDKNAYADRLRVKGLDGLADSLMAGESPKRITSLERDLDRQAQKDIALKTKVENEAERARKTNVGLKALEVLNNPNLSDSPLRAQAQEHLRNASSDPKVSVTLARAERLMRLSNTQKDSALGIKNVKNIQDRAMKYIGKFRELNAPIPFERSIGMTEANKRLYIEQQRAEAAVVRATLTQMQQQLQELGQADLAERIKKAAQINTDKQGGGTPATDLNAYGFEGE